MAWQKEAARDILALGSIPFYAIVMIRALIGPYYLFFAQLVIAAALLFAFNFAFKSQDNYTSRGFVLLVLTSIFYQSALYTIFASLLWLLLVLSSAYLKKKKIDILKGFLSGIVSAALAYYIAGSLSLPA